jgi:hypothetical protein
MNTAEELEAELSGVDGLLNRLRPLLAERETLVQQHNEHTREADRISKRVEDIDEEVAEVGPDLARAVQRALDHKEREVRDAVKPLDEALREHWPEWMDNVEAADDSGPAVCSTAQQESRGGPARPATRRRHPRAPARPTPTDRPLGREPEGEDG